MGKRTKYQLEFGFAAWGEPDTSSEKRSKAWCGRKPALVSSSTIWNVSFKASVGESLSGAECFSRSERIDKWPERNVLV
jgi:hypothetical protein